MVDEEKTGSGLKLSEAIRRGARLRPQARGDFFMFVWDDHSDVCELGSCALGAAFEAAYPGEDVEEIERAWGLADLSEELFEAFPVLREEQPALPGAKPLSLFQKVSRLNDKDGWTREHIADWLERQGH